MPIIQGPNANAPANDFHGWGLVQFKAGQRNITESHFHDCDEFVFMISGKMLMRSEGIEYILGPGHVLATRMGDEHEVIEIIEDTTYFWCETTLRGQNRHGHLIKGVDPK